MKINRLDAHDRYQHLIKQEMDIGACCQNLIDKRPFGDHSFYIFAHARTMDDGVTKKLLWQPRLTKPRMETNSMLFKVTPGTDVIKIIWMLPAEELWGQYKKGNITQNETVSQSIYDYKHNRAALEAREPDDLDDEAIRQIYLQMARSLAPQTFEMI